MLAASILALGKYFILPFPYSLASLFACLFACDAYMPSWYIRPAWLEVILFQLPQELSIIIAEINVNKYLFISFLYLCSIMQKRYLKIDACIFAKISKI